MSGKGQMATVIEISSDEEVVLEKKPKLDGKAPVLHDIQQKPKKKSLFDYFTSTSTGSKRTRVEEKPDLILDHEENSGNSSNSDEKQANSSQSPYYLKNFWLIINTIFGSDDQVAVAKSAFSTKDREIINALRSLSEDCQRMFIRLFTRQKKWILRSKINYERELSRPNISDIVLSQLVRTNLLFDRNKLTDIEQALNLLAADQAKKFAANFGLFPQTKAKTFATKQALIDHVLSLKSSLSREVWDKKEARFIGNCREMIGQCYSMPKEVKMAFLRCFLLFSLIGDVTRHDSKSSGQSTLQSQLFSLLEVERGNVSFPIVNVEPASVEGALDLVYRSPEELDLALWFYMKSEKISAQMMAKNLNFELASKIQSRYSVVNVDVALESLPKFLRSMSLPSIAKRALFSCSEILERGKQYVKAMALFRLILDTNPKFAQSLRRKVYPRLIIDQDRHLNDPSGALKSALNALANDESLTLATRWEIEDRVMNELGKRAAKKSNLDLQFQPQVILGEDVIREIKASMISYEFEKVKTKFYRVKDDGAVEICSVEETASDFYLANDFEGEHFSEVLHAEGGSICTLLGLLFWDVIFSSKTSSEFPVFITKFQSAPLDLYSGVDFYKIRHQEIENRLELIGNDDENMSTSTEVITSIWLEHENVQAQPISWSIFSDLEQVCRLVRAIGAKKLQFLMRTLITDLHFFHSGFPDLTLWDAESKSVRFVEVKGPGDSLSPKQRIWLDLLRRNGISAEVCRVEGVKSRRL